ncbi:type II secretion system protein N [Brenneria goodwinii]|uniref:type II secretion system protein N n=1 Tax=Brenneria goodwinii TaxID=1109412 RepID=UPI0036EE25D6
MRANVRLGAAFMLIYLLFLIIQLPARLLISRLPADISAAQATGTLWQGELQQVRWRTHSVGNVSWRIGLSALMPALHLRVQNPDGISAQGKVRGGRTLQFEQWQLSAPAGYVLSHLPLSVPLSATGRLQLQVQRAAFTRFRCDALVATLSWRDASLISPLGGVELANPLATLGCRQGNIDAQVRQKSTHMQLSGRGSLTPSGQYRFAGRLTREDGLPAGLKQLLAAQRNLNARGEMELKVEGRLKPVF